ncbi:MAG TPA: hypothetical protein VHT52_22560 [Stellaceae bacterium]|jgi:hypothetical protein|nr:hypothetical protein [Stellaceae bacterium]
MKPSDHAGPTGKFPMGRLNDEDRGELAVAVSTEKDMLRIDFGTPVNWICLPPDGALEFAAVIVARAMAMKRGEA